jgi:TonB-dependent receptor
MQASMLAATTIAAAAMSTQSVAAESTELEEIVVTGVRGAQQAAIDIKRDASQIVDAISAEDIGKLPDVTISDSLQRVPGIQVRRDAGEGSQVAIRGLPQVMTQLNGEQYLGANSTTQVQPNFGDIPSQLFSGVEVYKTSTATLVNSGVTGTVNLKTRRPFDLPSGFTASVAAEGSYGSGAEEFDPQANALLAWNNDRFGALVSVAYSNVNLANYYSGVQNDAGWTGRPAEDDRVYEDDGTWQGQRWAGWTGLSSNSDFDINNDGDITDEYIAFQGHTAFNRFTERERAGVNGSFQVRFTDALELVADVFYTDQQQFVRTAGMAAENKWQNWGWWNPLQGRDTGAEINGNHTINTTQVYALDTLRLKSFSQVQRTDSDSTNINLELKFDNGGPFTGSLRAIHGEATNNTVNSYADIDLANGSQWLSRVGAKDAYQGNFPYYPGGYQNPYPNGYVGNQQIVADYTGEHVRFSGIPGIVSDLDAYTVGAIASENNFDREADLSVFRLDGNYKFSDTFSLDAGIRLSEREATQLGYDYLAPLYASASSTGNGCLVKWKATDVRLDNAACSAGDNLGSTPDGVDYYTALQPLPLSSFGSQVIQVTDYGNAAGVPPIYTLNPEAMDDPLAFHNSLFPGNQKVINPGQSFGVNVDQQTFLLQANVGGGDMFYSANFGFQYINTELEVIQNTVGGAQPYGAANADIGDFVTEREFHDWLPKLNLSFDLRDDLKFRVAYTKTMTLLDLQQWGGALSPSYSISNADGGLFIVQSANSEGNPELDPWRSSNYDASLEWYPTDNTMVSFALFHIDIESFITRGTVQMALPDQDGVVRRTVSVNTNVQGAGGSLDGAEVAIKHAFVNLPGFWSDFGVDANYTYSPSSSGREDLDGSELPFVDNSKTQTNLVLWYENDRFQARVAHNHRSKRVHATDQVWGTAGLTLYQAPTDYVDASVSLDVTENFTVYLQGLNLTDEYENYYLQWEDQPAYQQQYERRFILGVRGRF